MNYIEKLKFLIEYNPKKGGLLNEIINGYDISNWLNIGKFYKYNTDGSGPTKLYYLFVNPNAKEISDLDIFRKDNFALCDNPDGVGNSRDLNAERDYRYDKIELYPEYQDGYYATALSGISTEKYKQKKHEELMSKVFIIDNKVVLHHNSSYKITDGVVKRGKTNGYSNNNDWGVYFWASKHSGNDQSGGGMYTYYCLVNLDMCYDVTNNVENFTSDVRMSRRYPYHLKSWENGDAVACQTSVETPIWCIKDNSTGKFYNKNWEEIEKPNIL